MRTSDKGNAGRGQRKMQANPKVSRNGLRTDSQQGQSEANRMKAVERSEKKTGK